MEMDEELKMKQQVLSVRIAMETPKCCQVSRGVLPRNPASYAYNTV